MTITLDALTLPDGLVWQDEFTWSPQTQAADYSLTGALIVQAATKLAGRPITLVGQTDGRKHTALLTRNQAATLHNLLTNTDRTLTLTLHDSRVFTVIPRYDDGAIEVEPLPIAYSFFPAKPGSAYIYRLPTIRLMAL